MSALGQKRTFRSAIAISDSVQPHVIEAILNHISGHKAGVAGIYNRSTYATEKCAALDLWSNHIRVIVAQSDGANVHKLKRVKSIPA
jgi:hypothetical protein